MLISFPNDSFSHIQPSTADVPFCNVMIPKVFLAILWSTRYFLGEIVREMSNVEFHVVECCLKTNYELRNWDKVIILIAFYYRRETVSETTLMGQVKWMSRSTDRYVGRNYVLNVVHLSLFLKEKFRGVSKFVNAAVRQMNKAIMWIHSWIRQFYFFSREAHESGDMLEPWYHDSGKTMFTLAPS